MAPTNGSDSQRTLRHAASVIFALVAIVPLLVVTYTLYALDVLRHPEAQAALAFSLAVSLLGYSIFRSMLRRMSENVEALSKAVTQANRGYELPTAPASRSTGVARPAPLSGASAGAIASSLFAVAARDDHVAGVGPIREFGAMARMMNQMWFREATRYRGRRVQVSVADAPAPLLGVISDVTDDGFCLDQDGATRAVSYRRVQSIEEVDPAS